MIPFVFFLFAVLFWGVLRYVLFTRGMAGAWSHDEPAKIARTVWSANRSVLIVTLAIVVVAAVLEALIPSVSDAFLDFQYLIGGSFSADPTLIYETGSGTVSWGLYLGILIGTLIGLLIGTLSASRRYPLLSGLSLQSYF